MIVIKTTRLVLLYRADNLTSHIGRYSIYTDVEQADVSLDSYYLALSLSDHRVFYLVICDPKDQHHMSRVKVRIIINLMSGALFIKSNTVCGSTSLVTCGVVN